MVKVDINHDHPQSHTPHPVLKYDHQLRLSQFRVIHVNINQDHPQLHISHPALKEDPQSTYSQFRIAEVNNSTMTILNCIHLILYQNWILN